MESNSRKRNRRDEGSDDKFHLESSGNSRRRIRRKNEEENSGLTTTDEKEISTSSTSATIVGARSNSNSKRSETSRKIEKRKKETPEKNSKTDGKKDVKSADEKIEVQCGICLEIVELQGILNNCTHSFCVTCIKEWAKTSNTCPFCKARFSQISESDLTAPQKKVKKTKVKYAEERGTEDEYAALPASYFLFMNDNEEYDSEMDEDYEDFFGEDDDMLDHLLPDYDIGAMFGFGDFSDDSDMNSSSEEESAISAAIDDFIMRRTASELIDLTEESDDDEVEIRESTPEPITEVQEEISTSTSNSTSTSTSSSRSVNRNSRATSNSSRRSTASSRGGIRRSPRTSPNQNSRTSLSHQRHSSTQAFRRGRSSGNRR